MSVIGIDDMDTARFVDLTTVAQDVVAQGRYAAVQLIRLLSGEADPDDAVQRLEPIRLVLRESTAPPHRGRAAGASLLSSNES